MICIRPLSLAYRWLHSCSNSVFITYIDVSKFSFHKNIYLVELAPILLLLLSYILRTQINSPQILQLVRNVQPPGTCSLRQPWIVQQKIIKLQFLVQLPCNLVQLPCLYCPIPILILAALSVIRGLKEKVCEVGRERCWHTYKRHLREWNGRWT